MLVGGKSKCSEHHKQKSICLHWIGVKAAISEANPDVSRWTISVGDRSLVWYTATTLVYFAFILLHSPHWYFSKVLPRDEWPSNIFFSSKLLSYYRASYPSLLTLFQSKCYATLTPVCKIIFLNFSLRWYQAHRCISCTKCKMLH